MADPSICHLLLVLSCIPLHLLIHIITPALAQLEPAFSPGEAPNDNNVQDLASPPAPAAPPSDSPTIDFPAPNSGLSPAESPAKAPTPAVHLPNTLSPGADAPSPTGSIITAPMSQPAPAPAPVLDLPFESTYSPPAPPVSPLLAPWRSSSLPTSSSSSSSSSSSKEGLSAAKKAGISVGVLLSVALSGLVAFIIKRRRHNIQRSQYGPHSQYRGRGYHGDTL